ncbi:LysR family transcriptional regulator [Dongshaea marina]|uniref:LysR family transcriptional regulator n=1 Tax=Dongshaea marina TaxID=2047966 RepID=UPI000D3EA65E|nr:LysR family transcriptional regulator [Dongshaea marina]
MLFEELETLLELSRQGSMGKTAGQLYVSQSAVSKRIANLERRLGRPLIEPSGRKIELTAHAHRLLDRLEPALGQLKGVLFDETEQAQDSPMILACSETLVAGLVAPALAEYYRRDPWLRVATYHTPVIASRVQSGEAALGLCAGYLGEISGVSVECLAMEPFWLVSPSRLCEKPRALITNDLSNPANRYQAGVLQQHGIEPLMQLDSYTASAELALAGVAPALVPQSIVRALQIDAQHCHEFGFLEQLKRPISLCYRHAALQRDRVRQLAQTIRDVVQSAV